VLDRRGRVFTEHDWHRVTYEDSWKHSLSFLVLPIIAGQPYLYHTEHDLHRDIAKALSAARVPFRHEVTLGPGAKVDFVSRGVGIEVKTAGRPADVSEQLQRYHMTGKLNGLLLLTTRADHLAQIPEVGLGGVTVVINLWATVNPVPRSIWRTVGARA
jgi:hypothetical protein